MSNDNVIVYDINFINELASTFNAILDEDVQNNLLEIKRTNKFIRRRSPIRLKYKISVADKWRDSRLNTDTILDIDKYDNSLISNLKYQDINVVITTEINTAGYFKDTFRTTTIIDIAKIPINSVGL